MSNGRTLTPRTTSAELQTAMLLTGGAALAILFMSASLDRWSISAMSGAFTGLVLFSGSMRLAGALAKRHHADLSRIFRLALTLKFSGTFARMTINNNVYGFNGDADAYVRNGGITAKAWRAGNFITDVGVGNTETKRIALVVAAAFVVTGASFLTAAFTFTVLSYWGQYLFFRALVIAVPDADRRRYAILVMLFPSLLYWPSAVGKEALMIFGIGVASYGAANLLRAKPKLIGLAIFLVGVLGVGLIRPHLALMAVIALLLASAVGSLTRASTLQDLKTSGLRMVALVVLIVAASVGVSQVSSMFSDGNADEEGSITSVLETTTTRTASGGSAFESPAVTSPVDLPGAIVTVLFRPFPWDAGGVTGLLSAAEGLGIFALLVGSWRRYETWFRLAWRNPYLIYALTYTGVFIVAFSYVSNFGILARQRSQLLPLLFVLVSMPARPSARERRHREVMDRRGCGESATDPAIHAVGALSQTSLGRPSEQVVLP